MSEKLISEASSLWRRMLLLTSSVLALGLSVFAEEPVSGGLAAMMKPFVDNQTMAGAVMLVGTKDKILDLEAVGYSDLAAKTPMTTDNLFWIASMSKAMSTSLLMMLADEGKLNVDDPVEKYLPEFKGQMVVDPKDPTKMVRAPSHPITIREIMSHTSGLPFRPIGEIGPMDTRPLAKEISVYASRPLIYDPGTQYVYANAGINTAARIVEVVSGTPYETFLQQRLFDPLGMHDTTFWPSADQLKRLAKSYVGETSGSPLKEIQLYQLTYPLDDRTKRFPMPAGGLFSTATDVARFCQMFLNGGTLDGKAYLSPLAVHAMSTKETGPKVTTSYGFGWSVGAHGDYSHGGAFSTYMGVDPARGIVTVFLVQIAHKWGTADGPKVLKTFLAAAQSMVGSADSSKVNVSTEGQQPH